MRRLWKQWRNLARKVGNFQARILLTLFYFTVAAPFGLGTRWFADPLHARRAHGAPAWDSREPRGAGLTELRRQY
jgi:hypothetical protein